MSTRLMMMGGSLATFKLIRLYRSDKGIWRYEIERSGNLYSRQPPHARRGQGAGRLRPDVQNAVGMA